MLFGWFRDACYIPSFFLQNLLRRLILLQNLQNLFRSLILSFSSSDMVV